MSACEANEPLAKIVPCTSEGRWVGPDGRARCSMHHISAFGHGSELRRVEGYQPPAERKPPAEPDKLPGTHAALDSYALERGIDLGDARTVAEKQAVIEAAT